MEKGIVKSMVSIFEASSLSDNYRDILWFKFSLTVSHGKKLTRRPGELRI